MITFNSKDYKTMYKRGNLIKIGEIYNKEEIESDKLIQIGDALNNQGKEAHKFNVKMQESIGRIMIKLQQGCKSEQVLVNDNKCDLDCDMCKHIDIERSNERIKESHKMLNEYIEQEEIINNEII